MTKLTAVATAYEKAVSSGVPKDVAMTIITTVQTEKLRGFFREASQRFFSAHKAVFLQSGLEKEHLRCKAIMDLILARQRLTGVRKPTVEASMRHFDATAITAGRATRISKVVQLRQAA